MLFFLLENLKLLSCGFFNRGDYANLAFYRAEV
jgi:hypothetical protein